MLAGFSAPSSIRRRSSASPDRLPARNKKPPRACVRGAVASNFGRTSRRPRPGRRSFAVPAPRRATTFSGHFRSAGASRPRSLRPPRNQRRSDAHPDSGTLRSRASRPRVLAPLARSPATPASRPGPRHASARYSRTTPTRRASAGTSPAPPSAARANRARSSTPARSAGTRSAAPLGGAAAS
jgi:hypothetical protein